MHPLGMQPFFARVVVCKDRHIAMPLLIEKKLS